MHWKQQELDTNTPRLNFLVAYPYCKPDVFEVLKNQTLPYRFLLDSGALIYLQPISQGAEATKLCVETAMANDWRVSVQVHKYPAVR